MRSTVKPGRIASLDGWRAISRVLVLLWHGFQNAGYPDLQYPWRTLFTQGDFGVRIFFVISGFLITHLMLHEFQSSGQFDLKQFYIRRVLRIFPVYFGFLAVLGFAQAYGFFHDAASSWFGALTFTRNMFGRGDSPSVHLWSLAVEEQFYLAWPVACYALSLFRRPNLAMIVLLAIVGLAFLARMAPNCDSGFVCKRLLGEKSALRYADCLAIGCLGAFAAEEFRRRQLWLPKFAPDAVGLAAVFALLASLFLTVSSGMEQSALITAQAVLTMAAIFSSTQDRFLAAILNQPLLILVGVISYSLYIWHYMFLSCVVPGFRDYWFASLHFWWLTSLVVAAASYYLYERRFLKLRRQHRPVPLPSD